MPIIEKREFYQSLSPEGLRGAIAYGDVDAYGEYTERHWFSNGDIDPYTEDFAHQGAGKSLTIMTMGLAGETGEVIEKIKKIYRGDPGAPDLEAIKKELGDAFFYLVRLCKYFGWGPTDVINRNVEKLDDRRARGASRGSGDNR